MFSVRLQIFEWLLVCVVLGLLILRPQLLSKNRALLNDLSTPWIPKVILGFFGISFLAKLLQYFCLTLNASVSQKS